MLSHSATEPREEPVAGGFFRPGGLLRRGIDILASGRLAVVLLAILVLLLILYLFIPQAGPDGVAHLNRWVLRNGFPAELCRTLGLTDIRNSLWLYGTFTLLFMNLLLCMIRRLPTVILFARMPVRPPASFPRWPHREVAAGRLAEEEIAGYLGNRGYRTLVFGDTVFGLRGGFAASGHWLFHVGLLILLAGGALAGAGSPPFRGIIGIGEGENFQIQKAPFLSTNQPPASDLPDLEFRVEQIEVTTAGEDVRQFDVRVFTPGGETATLGINRPFRRRPYQVIAHGFGYMPGWVIVDETGRMRKGAWLKLSPFPLQEEESFRIGPRTSKVHVRFFPDYRPGGSGGETSGGEVRNPRFRSRIELRGEQIFEGLLRPEQKVALGDGLDFFFLADVRRYVLLDVIEEKGHRTIFSGFGIMIFGLFLRHARIRKEIVVQVDGESLRVFGRSEFFPNLFEEELDSLAGELAAGFPRRAGRRA